MNSSPKTLSSVQEENEFPQPSRPKESWGLLNKTTLAMIGFATVPMLLVSVILYAWGLSLNNRSTRTVTVTEVQKYSDSLGLGIGVLGIASGAIAALLARKKVNSVVNAANTANTLVNRLRREDISVRSRVAGQDELVALESNLEIVYAQFPQLLASQESETERSKIAMEISQRLRVARSDEEVFRVSVEEIRQVFRADRVAIFRFDSAQDGTIVEESVASGCSKMLWSSLTDPCLANYLTQYQNGYVRAIDDIYNAGLDDCHIGLLERFAVKANLIAPIVKGDQVFGLLIAHQCTGARFWLQTEIDLFLQLSGQIGFALDRTGLLEQIDAKASQSHHFIEISRRMQSSLNPDDILQITVDELRKVLVTDRVMVYSFDSNWYGTVVAESVVPGFPKALWAKIKDPCFAEGYVEQYCKGRVQSTNNIYEAGLTECHLKQLEPFSVKANLVAPILQDDHLFGLLIAHACSKPRNWQQSEIDLVTQVATQAGLMLHSASILDQVDQAYQLAESTSVQQDQKLQKLQHQASEWIKQSEPAVQTFANDVSLQMESVTALYHQLKHLATEIQDILLSLSQQQNVQQQTHRQITEGQNALESLHQNLLGLQTNGAIAAECIQHLTNPAQQVAGISNRMTQLASQMKLQAMNAALEATRTGESAQEFATIGEKVLDLARQLDTQTGDLAAIAKLLESQLAVATGALQDDIQHRKSGWQSLEQVEQTFAPILETNIQLKTWLESMVQTLERQSEASDLANQSILEVASHANQATEHATLMSSALTQLTALSTAEETV